MKIRRRTEIRVETREVLVLRRHGSVSLWCEECGAQVKALSPEGAAAAMGTSLRAVFRQVEVGGLHFKETDGGVLLICFNSITAYRHRCGQPFNKD